MKWTECTADNANYTNRFDAAIAKIKDKLGSYDTISQLIFRETGESYAGVSTRRWFVNRTLPVTVACTLVDLMEGEVKLADLFPYLEEYFDDGFLD